MAIHSVLSTLSGTFYRSAAPGLSVFKKERDLVQPDDVIGMVEVMKQFSEVTAEVTGIVIRFYPDDESPVDAGGRLVDIETA
jgi:acetyl-CoA carboxylase biotin carboxyl carrier protein